MKRTVALTLVIGLVCAPASYAQTSGKPDSAGTASPEPASVRPSPDQQEVKKRRSSDDFITLNFTNIDISALVKVMSELTRRNFILDERVTGKVTLMTPTKISPDEAYQVFLSALEIKGFTAFEDGKVVRIIAAASARQSGLKVVQDGDMRGEGFVTKLIRMSYVNPQEIVRTISPLVSKDGSILAYAPTNSVIVTDTVSNIRKLDSLIHAMDTAAPDGKGKINVYYLRNANSEELAKIMQALVSKLPVPTAAGAAQAAGAASILEGSVSINSDKATNSLIVVASPGDYEIMKDVIQKLDIRRRQVYVEAAIIEMSLSKQRDLGFEFQVPVSQSAIDGTSAAAVGGTNFGNIGNVVTGGPAGLASMNGLAIGAIKGSFTYNGTTFLSVGALLHALQTDSDVNVLSTPNILTMDNQKAEIMVGQNVPFVTGQTQNATTGSGTLFNSIERKDVGISLKITPQITSDDNVRLEIYQEISDVVQSATASSNGPTTSKRSASTTVVVKDRQTMVIGGLIRDNVVATTSKVPFLGDIPVLGWLFKSKSTRVEKTNLMIFLTPYIIKDEAEANELTNMKNKSLEDFRKEYRIEKKSIEPTKLKPKAEGPSEKPAAAVTAPAAAGSAPTVTAAPSSAAPQQPEAVSGAPVRNPPVVSAPPQEPASSPTATLPPGKPEAPKEDAR